MLTLYGAYEWHEPNKPRRYIDAYRDILYCSPVKSILELGVQTGDSLRMWADAFPSATIVGMDRDRPSKPGLPGNVSVFQVEQSDTFRMATFASQFAPFDLIIDDCSHQYAETHAAFLALFRLLRPDGWYAIEDIASYGWANMAIVRSILARQQLTVYKAEHVRADGDNPFAEVRVLADLALIRRQESGGGDWDGLVDMPLVRPVIPLTDLVSADDLIL